MFQDQYLHLPGKGRLIESGFTDLWSFCARFSFQEVFHRCDRKSAFLRLEMHGDEDFGFDLLRDAGGFFRINGKETTNGDQKNVHGTDLSQFFITQEMTQVSEVAELDIVDLQCEDGVGASFTPLGGIVVSWDAFH